MAEKEYYVGGIGPYVYESTDSESLGGAFYDDGFGLTSSTIDSMIASGASVVASGAGSTIESSSSVTDSTSMSISDSSAIAVSVAESNVLSGDATGSTYTSTTQSLAYSSTTSAVTASGVSSEAVSEVISTGASEIGSTADSVALSQSAITSTAQSTADAASPENASTADSTLYSTVQSSSIVGSASVSTETSSEGSEGKSAAASAAKAGSTSGSTSGSRATSTAGSSTSTAISTANSVAASNASRASIAESNTASSVLQISVADSTVLSTNSTANSSTSSTNLSNATSKVVSASVVTSTNLSWTESTNTSQSKVVSEGDSVAGSASISTSTVVSGNRSTADSSIASQSLVVSQQDSSGKSTAGSAATSNSKVMSTNLSTTYSLSITSSQNLSVVDSAADVIAGNVSDIGDLWTIRLSKTSRVAGIALIGDPTTSSNEFVVMTDSFKVIDTAEGYAAKLVFTTGLVGGVGAVGINGNVLIDGTIAATQVGANQIVTSAANISNAAILTAHISDAQITNAKISNVTADKIKTGYLTGQQITLSATSSNVDAFINWGKTDFTNNDTGFILGADASAALPKFYIGTSTSYFNFTGAACAFRGESTYYGDRGDGTSEVLGSIKTDSADGYNYIATFGSTNSGCSKTAMYLKSYNQYALAIASAQGTPVYLNAAATSGAAVVTYNPYGYGGFFANGAVGNLCLGASLSSAAPTHSANKGMIWVTSGGVPYMNFDGSTAWRVFGMHMKVGTYTGTGVDGATVNIGLSLSTMTYVVLIVKNVTDSSEYMVMRTSSQSGDQTMRTGASGSVIANLIQSFAATGFTVGDDNAVNHNGDTYLYAVFYQES